MNEETGNNVAVAVFGGLFIGLLSLLWLLAEWKLGLHEYPGMKNHPWVTVLGMLIPLFGLGLIIRWVRKNEEHHFTWFHGFGYGVLATVVGLGIFFFGQRYYLSDMNPAFYDDMIRGSIRLGKNGQEARDYFTPDTYLVRAPIWGVGFDLFVCGVSSAIQLYIANSRKRRGIYKTSDEDELTDASVA